MESATRPGLFFALLRSMRPQQWIKNLLLFAGIIFSRNLADGEMRLRALAGFALFCLISGCIYIINDLADIESDRLHPTKKNRPLAAGILDPRTALIFAVFAVSSALGFSFLLSVKFGLTALAYFIITVLYSHIFKHVVFIDVILLSLGFVLRAIAGVMVISTGETPVPMTPWFIMCVLFLALFISICKRRHELLSLDEASSHRRMLADLNPDLLNQMISISAAATIITYALYLVAETSPNGNGPHGLKMISSLPFVIYGIFRYLYLVFKCQDGGEPDKLIVRDKPLLLNTLLWLLIMIFLYYGD